METMTTVETSESIWQCGRGRTQLSCHLRQDGDREYQVEVLRNGRLYGTYQFVERAPAMVFASRLRNSFEGNGWTPVRG